MSMMKLRDILGAEVDLQRLGRKTGLAQERLQELVEDAEPTLAELRKLAAALKIPLSDFADTDSVERISFLFRDTKLRGKPIPRRVVSTLGSRIAGSSDLFGVRASESPWWFSRFSRGSDSFESAEQNASIFRELFFESDQLSPLIELPRIAVNRMGVMLFVINNPDVEGASTYFEGVPYAFVSARFHPRMLFTVAHELGHLISHHDPSVSVVIIDEAGAHEGEGGESDHVTESYANAFASALLMPKAAVGIMLKAIRKKANISDGPIGDLEISYLARFFGVSFWAAARRCEDLKLLPRGGAASLNDELESEFGSAEKRADQAGLPPRAEIDFPRVPGTLLASAIEKVRAGQLSAGRAAAVLGIPISDLLEANRPATSR